METETIDTYKLCPRCGNFSHVKERNEFCILCGEKFLEKCPWCKELIIYPTAVFCHKCGTKLVYKNDKQI